MTPTQRKDISETFSKERSRLLGFIRKRIPVSLDAEDILQDVFYQLTVGFNDIRSLGNVTAWLYRVASNRITDAYRKKRPDNFSDHMSSGKDEDDPLMLQDIIPSMEESPDNEMLRELIMDRIDSALDEMPPEQRDVFIFHEFEEKTFKEISEMTGTGINTLLSRKRYAVLFLREKLKDIYESLNY
jgi:RNA polymerase sigma factor (sigma-70 family)